MLSSWPDETDSSGVKVRNISYTLTLTNPLGPKTSPSTERQVSPMFFFDCRLLLLLSFIFYVILLRKFIFLISVRCTLFPFHCSCIAMVLSRLVCVFLVKKLVQKLM